MISVPDVTNTPRPPRSAMCAEGLKPSDPGAGASSADEGDRLVECAQEPIHLPGAIQPHGSLLTVDPGSLEILQASSNCLSHLGVATSRLLGTAIGDLVGPEVEAALRAGFASGIPSERNLVAASVDGREVDLIVHQAGDVGVVEFESGVASPSTGCAYLLTALHRVLQRLSKAADVETLRWMAAHEIRRLAGYDQVIVYNFHADGHGEVVADEHHPGMNSYLGSHFPASDIPFQARRLYQGKGSGLIATTEYQPAALVPTCNPRTGAPLDLSGAELRSVSPHHLEFMRNMGQGASLTLSLVHDGQLLGLITCAHRQPRWVPLLLRQTCEIVAQQVVLQLRAMTSAQGLTRRLEARDVRAQLVSQMRTGLDVAAGLTRQAVTVVDLIEADGATSLHRRPTDLRRRDPRRGADGGSALGVGTGTRSLPPLLTDSLALDRSDLAELVPSVAGAFVLPFGSGSDCLLWFRNEIIQSVNWLGPQSADNRRTPLSPRNSFELWRQTVTDRSRRLG